MTQQQHPMQPTDEQLKELIRIHSPKLLGSTLGQWRSADYLGLPEIERRVSLVFSRKGFHIWTADFRNERSGRVICQKFFAAMPRTNQVVAVFDTVQEREAWFKAN